MIRMTQCSTARHAKSYFAEELNRTNYYLDAQELPGSIHGKVAQRLGILGSANKEVFHALCDNKHPFKDERLTQRVKERRTVLYDINWHASKSISLVNALAKDGHIQKAFQDSVHETMLDIEKDCLTRVRVGRQHADRLTGEMVWAEFVHLTARPVNGMPDPHLHIHATTWNVTWDQVEQKYKAGQFRNIKRDMPYYQSLFHKRLADKLVGLGYSIRRTDKAFEITGVPQGVIDHFSKRTDQIGRIASELGIKSPQQLDKIGERIRAKKAKHYSMSELKKLWKDQIKNEVVIGSSEQHQPVRQRHSLRKAAPAEECAEFALHHCFERSSVVQDRRILAIAYRQALGSPETPVQVINDVFLAHPSLLVTGDRNGTFCTTKEVLAEEQRLLEIVKSGIGQYEALYSELPTIKSGGQHADAIRHVLTSKDGVSLIRGAAGTGKTTMTKELVELIACREKKIVMLAPTSEASRGVLRSEGFEGAETLSKFLIDPKLQDMSENQFIILDEAGLCDMKSMLMLMEIATTRNARVILLGDQKQHSSVSRGDAMRLVVEHSGLPVLQLTTVYRQKTEAYRMAVEDLSIGNIPQAFSKLDEMGCIHEVPILEPYKQIVEDVISCKKKNKSYLIVAPTHRTGIEVTEALREKLKKEGLLGKKESSVSQLLPSNFTEAERSDWRNFKKGHIIQFNQNLKGIKRGSKWNIEFIENGLIVLTDGERNIPLPLNKASSFEVYNKTEIALSKGDKIKITRNSFDKNNVRLNNGQIADVIDIDKETIKLKTASNNKVLLDREFGHLNHAYAVTSHASQGKTVDSVFIMQPTWSFAASGMEQFYVSVSRARENCQIYTDDTEELLVTVSQSKFRKTAIEHIGFKMTE